MTRVHDHFSKGFDARIVSAWIADDPDPETARELQALLEATTESGHKAAEAIAELSDRFAAPLSFGTAGLRGELGGGPNRMNRAVVIRAAAGLSQFLLDTVGKNFRVVIGHDARFGSADFARDTAAVVTATGGHALLLPANTPTPVVAFATQHLDADAGVMVTASHNPPRDNGYKVYLGARPQQAVYSARGEDPAQATGGHGAQIVPPFDELIARHISQVESVANTPLAKSGWEIVGTDIIEDYLGAVRSLIARLSDQAQRENVHIVHSSLHGVGHDTAMAALELTGVARVTPVAKQAQPDPTFPTVAFPNPEEPGALDLAFEVAQHEHADLIIVNDPDADRFSAAIPLDEAHQGFRQLTGDEVGLLLGEFLAARLTHHGPTDNATPGSAPQVLTNSVVSSRGLAAIAQAHGLAHRNTLTGFKWITRGTDVTYGYEEALGYAVDPAVVRDKDGISAAVVFTLLVAELKAQDLSVQDELDRIRIRDGVFLTAPVTFRVDELSLIARAMEQLRTSPPQQLAGNSVVEVLDLAAGSSELPPTNGIALLTQVGDRVIVRPSGTEPKLKCYMETVGAVPAAPELHTVISAANERLELMREDLLSYFDM